MFQEADLIAADLTMTDKRLEYVDFTVPFFNSHLTILVKVRNVLQYVHWYSNLNSLKSVFS